MGYFYILTLMAFAAICHASPFKRGSCITVCDIGSNQPCQDGYECQSNGCGHQCYRTTFVQPEGCQVDMSTCQNQCLLGYQRSSDGCEICECDYSPLMRPTKKLPVGR